MIIELVFGMGRERLFLVFPFFAPFLQFVCTYNEKNEGKSEK